MPTMNETSTITLPEYHNLLALLLLSLNTPSVSSSSTTQEEEMIKKRKKRDNAHTESGARQQKSRSSSTRSRQRSRPYTQDTPSKRETSVTPKKERQTKPVYHHEHANTNHTPKRRITPQRDKKKNHTTHSRLTSQHHPAIPAATQTHIQSLPHTSFLHPCRHPFLHPIRIPSTRLLTPCYHPLTTYCPLLLHHHLCLYYMPLPYHRLPAPCPQLHLCLSRSRYRSPSTCVPLPDGRYGPPPPGYHCLPVPLPARLLSTYCSHVCFHYCAHPSRHYA